METGAQPLAARADWGLEKEPFKKDQPSVKAFVTRLCPSASAERNTKKNKGHQCFCIR